MASHVVTGAQYLHDPSAVHGLGPFEYTFLSEGDSWGDKSTPVSGSLPQHLMWEMNKRGRSVLIINVAKGGDPLRRITDMMNGEFAWWLQQVKFDAILFSAGGTDLIDAARDPAPGKGILKDMAGQPLPADGYACVRSDALDELLNKFLADNFAAIYNTIRTEGKNLKVPIFLNCYDTPTARNAPAIKNLVGPWLYTAYTKNNIDPSLWPSLTAGLFHAVKGTIESWPKGRDHIYAVPTTGLLTPAKPGIAGSSGDWANEIHPNKSGWKKLAPVWADALLKRL